MLEDGALDHEGGDLVAGALDDVDAEGRGGQRRVCTCNYEDTAKTEMGR